MMLAPGLTGYIHPSVRSGTAEDSHVHLLIWTTAPKAWTFLHQLGLRV